LGLWQSYLINVSLRAVGVQKFFRTKGGANSEFIEVPLRF